MHRVFALNQAFNKDRSLAESSPQGIACRTARNMVPMSKRAVPIVDPATRKLVDPGAEPYDSTWPSISGTNAPTSQNATVSSHPNSTKTAVCNLAPPCSIRLPENPTLNKDNDYPESALDVYSRAYVPEAFRIINEFAPTSIFEVPNPRAIDYTSYIQSFGAFPYIQNRTLCGYARYSSLDRTPVYFEQNEFLEYEHGLSISEDYERYFECLIGREFAHHHAEHRLQSLYNQKLQAYPNSKDLYSLEWPGIREETPFIQAGDTVQLRQLTPVDTQTRLGQMEHWMNAIGRHHLSSGSRKPPVTIPPGWTGFLYTAQVYTVIKAKDIVVLFAPGLNSNAEFNVILPVQKNSYQAQLRAVAHFGHTLGYGLSNGPGKSWARTILFPKPDDGVMQTTLDPWKLGSNWFDEKLNFEQQKAVRSICRRQYGTVPYLISGPPGTGKTKTLVETALQLIRNPSSPHILVCAPSNAAADTLADRLSKHLEVHELLRLNAPGRNIVEVPEYLRRYCFSTTDDFFTLPDFPRLMKYKVVVTSCQDASMLVDASLTNMDLAQLEHGVSNAIHPSGSTRPYAVHWGALLLDEGTQAIEPEAGIPLSLISPPIDIPIEVQPLVVIAGDEHQLGPRTYSHHPRLKMSLFARLFKRPLYAEHPLSRQNSPPPLSRGMLPIIRPPFSNLFRNYRSHPAILAVPSSTFYADTLLANGEATDCLEGLPLWKGRRWPVLFIPNISDEDLDKDGGGWFNKGEARIAVNVAEEVLASGLIEEADIVIMSPFAAQVRLLRILCRRKSMWKVNIGPCEAFQGLESRFVILCTTRARERFLDRDFEVCKGVIKQPQRMNVSLTRAQHGLVVIGNSKLLAIDSDWVGFMKFCKRNGLVEGRLNEMPELDEVGDDLLRLEKVLLVRDSDAEFDASARQLGLYTDDDILWAQGLIAENQVSKEFVEEETEESSNPALLTP